MRSEVARIGAMAERMFVAVGLEAHRSIQSGSEITGSPGQPVDTGNLRNSWQLTRETDSLITIDTPVEYAQPIEDGVGRYGPLELRSAVGGFHSVALTVAGLGRIVDVVATRIAQESP